MTGVTGSPATSQRRFHFSAPRPRNASPPPTAPWRKTSSGGATSANDLGTPFGHGLYEREVEHLIRNEWAVSADDILWRRTKLGLHMSEAERARLSEWLIAREAAAASSAA